MLWQPPSSFNGSTKQSVFQKSYIRGITTKIGKSKRVLIHFMIYRYVVANPYIRGITTDIGKKRHTQTNLTGITPP